MSTDFPDPSAADTLPDLFRRQLNTRYPLAAVSAVARACDIPHGSLVAWLTGERIPSPEKIREALGKLDATEATIARALSLWAAAKGAA